MPNSFVYILSSRNNSVLYTGVTSNLSKRLIEHKTKFYPNSFTARYICSKLVYFLEFQNIKDAISFEKKIKAGNRRNKEKLIQSLNPDWKDLSEGWIMKP
ncbi:GIY-YIG nuclease family protein [Gramella sp. GC03-9]|uniref:GIY-YIG nuclease family protein n=1 Tax=Christiangramia oceanisediminis TaxID=2920386 RepID=A0A9X2I3G5_9FLAO|nr:GIY-YIG nuclease family protein [Gramella oceanisediminis]MCP9200015.1 GIY-YIG nuclease family protein [Gramella oceanisediminis]